MSERGCIKCGYNLAGLPAAGTVVSCPECGQANDLAVPLPRRIRSFEPILCGLIPVALFVLCLTFGKLFGVWNKTAVMFLLLAAVFSGGIAAGALTYQMLVRRPAMCRAPCPFWTKIALTACAGAVSGVVNAGSFLAMQAAIKWVLWQ